jgi:DNA uptake protein ComE-like DNA-binding protein
MAWLHDYGRHRKSTSHLELLLAVDSSSDENGSVQAIRITALAIIVLLGSLTGIAPSRGQRNTNSPKAPVTAPPSEARVDINHASVAELIRVPGLTRSWANRIVRFRPYYTKQDLLDMGVVNSQIYDRIRTYVIAHRDEP